ncbi:MAG: hypothetical protein OEY74_03260, partial [Gammaproteobacteria bacterium]|nr:hypothetical protein [Gammaproteobacteria bacterium]
VIEAGHSMGVFPEGVSHTESQLSKLKTGTARIALSVAARGKVAVTIIPCGLNYIHRHRFRSQVSIEFGEPIVVDSSWRDRFAADERECVRELTDQLAAALASVTVNAPDWSTLRFIQAARRLYKPSTAKLTPSQYMELNRRFVATYVKYGNEPDMLAFRDDVENYQSRLEVLGLKDHQLRKRVSVAQAFRRLAARSLMLMLLLPVAIPGALLHLPVAWIAAVVGERFSYEQDDVATLKVFASITLLPLLYLVAAFFIGSHFGAVWAIVAVVGLTISFSASILVIEAQATLLVSMVSILRETRLRAEIEDLQATRLKLVDRVRTLADQYADPETPRMFSGRDFVGQPTLQA